MFSTRPRVARLFQWLTGVIKHVGCWENTRKACKSRALYKTFLDVYILSQQSNPVERGPWERGCQQRAPTVHVAGDGRVVLSDIFC